MGSRRDVANRRQHRSGCASIPSSLDCASLPPVPPPPSLSRARVPCVPLPPARHSPREYVCHAFSVESLSVPLVPPNGPRVDLSLRLAPTKSVSLPLDRRFFRLPSTPARVPFLAPAVSLSIAFDRAYISLTRLYLSFFFLSRSLSRRVRLARAHGPRNSVEHTRRRAFDTLCSVSEGSVRRFRGEAPFSTYGAARLLSFSSSHAGTHSLLLLDNKRINVTLRSSLARAPLVAYSA